MKYLTKLAALIIATSMVFVGCQNKNTENDTSSIPEESQVSSSVTSESSENSESSTTESEPEKNKVDLYIGTRNNFKTYEVETYEEVTPDMLINEISKLTDWDLSLSEPVTTGKGGMSVTFSPECALVTGPPIEQKDEFHVFDSIGLSQMILDSIQETFLKNFIIKENDTTILDIYFSIDGKNINIPDLGKEIPFDKPYNSEEIFG